MPHVLQCNRNVLAQPLLRPLGGVLQIFWHLKDVPGADLCMDASAAFLLVRGLARSLSVKKWVPGGQGQAMQSEKKWLVWFETVDILPAELFFQVAGNLNNTQSTPRPQGR